MKFEEIIALEGLVMARLKRRYKRFLADVLIESGPDAGREITVHCPNTGAMTGCAEPGWRIALSDSNNPKRKYRYTWEWSENAAGDCICVHSARANRWAAEAVAAGKIPELAGYQRLLREQRLADGSRVDLLLQDPDKPDKGECLVEVKSATLLLPPELSGEQGQGAFPDAVSDRALKHIRALQAERASGRRAVLLFAVLHSGIAGLRPAAHIDPRYAQALADAIETKAGDTGVEVLAYGLVQDPVTGLSLERPLPFTVG